MAELSDHAIREIKESIKRFSKKYQEITTFLSRSRYDSIISSAETKLSVYVRAEENAVKTAQRIIDKGYNGSGFLFSTEGIEKILSKKSQDFGNRVLKIMTDYGDAISQIRLALPKIGSSSIDYLRFSSSDYSGDTEIELFARDTSYGGAINSDIQTNENEVFTKNTYDSEDLEPSTVETATIVPPSEAYEWNTPEELTAIAPGAISNTTIEKIVCTNVTEIQANAFKYVHGLKIVVISKSIKLININAFRGIKNKCIIAFKGDKASVTSSISQLDALANCKVIFSYNNGDENDPSKIEMLTRQTSVETKVNKRIVIKAKTPLNTIEIKELFLKRNERLGLTLSELEQGITVAQSDTDKDRILLEALKIKRKRDLDENSYWNYATALKEIIKLSRKLNYIDEALNAIFGLFFLDSSGYRMINGKNNPYKQDPKRMYYDPKKQMNDLYEMQQVNLLSEGELTVKYKSSPYVIELSKVIKDAYYSIDDSIKLMLMALENADYIFYPAKSGITRQN